MVELRNVLTQLPERASELEPLSGREVPGLLHRNGLQIKEFRKGLVMMDLHLIDNADLDLLAEKCARTGVTQGWRRSLVSIRHRSLDPVNGVADHDVMLTEIVEQGRERRELAVDAGGSDRALLEVLAPADDGSARDATQFRNAAQPEGDELLDIDLMGAAGFGIRR